MGGGKQYFPGQQTHLSGQPTMMAEVKPGDMKTCSIATTTTTMVTSRQPQMVIVQQQPGQPGQLPMQILEEHVAHGNQQHE
jgi:hypothetical protein